MRTYIISFYQQGASEEHLAEYLDTRPEVLNWLVPLPNTVFIVSKRDAEFIAKLILKKFPKSLFLVSAYASDNSNGLLYEDMWEFLNEPQKA